MIVIKEKRNCGKTEKLVALLEKDLSYILLVRSPGETRRIIEFYKSKINLSGRVMHWSYYLARPSLWGRPLLIDNIDIYLQHKFKTSDIVGVSINED